MKKQLFMFLQSPEFDVVSVNWVINVLLLQGSAHEEKNQALLSPDVFSSSTGDASPMLLPNTLT